MPQISPLHLAAVAGLALAGTACSAEIADYNADAETGSTHALITVDRSVAADGARAGALAGFVRMPADADAQSVLGLVGLGLKLPTPGQCGPRQDPAAGPHEMLAAAGRVEFLDAGDVAVDVGAGSMSLAPRAFPTVTDRISGMMYTTRDRSAEPLPAGVRYTIRSTGSRGVGAISVEANAPAALDGITVGGLPLGEVASVSVSQPIDLTWNVGSPGDLVYVELIGADGASGTVCTFRDDAGAGTVPGGAFARVGAGRLSIHRLRTHAFTSANVDQGELRFDFERATNVGFSG